MHSTNRSRAAIYFSPIWNGPAPSFQHRAAAVFPCGKGGEKCSFPHRKSAGGVQMMCRCAAMAGDRRFRMPAALLWAFSAEKLFFSLGQRNACGRSAVPFSREGHGRQAAGAAPAFDGSGGAAGSRTLSVTFGDSSPEGGAYLPQTVKCLKAPPSGELTATNGSRLRGLGRFRLRQRLPPRGSWQNR